MNTLRTLALASGLALGLGAAIPAQAHDNHWHGYHHRYVYSGHYARPHYYGPSVVYGAPYYYDDFYYPRYYAGPGIGLTFAHGGPHWRHYHHHG